MVTDIRITDFRESSELQQYALRRLGDLEKDPRHGIEEMSLSVNRMPSPGPSAIRCQILVRVSPRLSLSVERSEASARAAIDAAAERLGWALGVWHGRG